MMDRMVSTSINLLPELSESDKIVEEALKIPLKRNLSTFLSFAHCLAHRPSPLPFLEAFLAVAVDK
jgi:hypothetical protein